MPRNAHLQADLRLVSGRRRIRVIADGQQVRIRLSGGPLAWQPVRALRRLRRQRMLEGLHLSLTRLGLRAVLEVGVLPSIHLGHGVKTGWLLAALGVRRGRDEDRRDDPIRPPSTPAG
jgi:hypothetical protein